MTDRLTELREISKKNKVILKDNENTKITIDDNLFGKFNEQKTLCQDILEKIKKNNQQIQALKEIYIKATSSAQEKVPSEKINEIISQNNGLSKSIKDILGQINQDLEASQNSNPDLPETRMKQNIARALSNKVNEVLREYQNAQIEYKTSMKEKISRQSREIDPTLNDDQMKDLFNDPQKASQLLQAKLSGTASVQLQNVVSDIQDKFRDIQKLENSVTVVYQMFVDLALLVHQQGEMLDNIEISLNDSKSYVEQGEQELIKAQTLHKAARKKMCCIASILSAVLVAVLVPILAFAK